jgi:fatty-acyl-CoA synthase
MKNYKSFTLASYIDKMVHDNPNQVISTFKDEINVFNIGELNHKANLLAKGLLYIGIGKGTPVALVLSGTTNCLTFVVALSKIGAILVPINKDQDIEKIMLILQQTKVVTIGFYADHFLEKFKQIIPDYLNSERGYLNNNAFPFLKNVVTFGSIKNRGIFTTREIMLLGEHTDDFEIEEISTLIQPDDIFLQSCTFDKKGKIIINITKQGDVISDSFSFSVLQNYVINSI